MHYWISYCARRALEVPQPQAKGPPGPGGHNNLSNSVLEGLLYFISPLYGQNLCCFFYLSLIVTILYLFSAKQYYEPDLQENRAWNF